MHNKGLPAGWGWPLLEQWAHYYPEGELISVCAHSIYSGRRDDSNHNSLDNCAECRSIIRTWNAPYFSGI